MRHTEMLHIAKVTLGSLADQSPARERPSTVHFHRTATAPERRKLVVSCP